MYYFKLGLKNTVRSMRYSIPLFLIFVFTVALVTVTDGARYGGEAMRDEIAAKYTVTVEAVENRPVTPSGKKENIYIEKLTYEDGELPGEYPELSSTSFYFEDINHWKPYIWEINFDIERLKTEDVRVENTDLIETIIVYGAKNTQFNSKYGKLVDGRHISDDLDDGNYCLVSENICSILGLGVGDKISFPLFDIPNIYDIKTQESEIIGVLDSYSTIIFPHERLTDYYSRAEKDSLELSELKFILNSPTDARSFIDKTRMFFDEKHYALMADDGEYKKEVYPIEMMMKLNTTLSYAAMATGGLLIAVITAKSATARSKDIAVLRSLSCKKRNIYMAVYTEKIAVMLAGVAAGTALGIVFSRIYNGANSLPIPLLPGENVFQFIGISTALCLVLISVIYISAVYKKPGEVINE